MDTLLIKEIHDVSQSKSNSRPQSEERPRSGDSSEEERCAMTDSINSIETRTGDIEDGSSLKRTIHEDLNRRRLKIINSFRIGSVVSSHSGSSRPSTDIGYRGRTPLPLVIDHIVSQRGDEL